MSEVTTDMICEQHPTKPWPHDDCAGPGMPWQAGLDLLARSEQELAEATALLRRLNDASDRFLGPIDQPFVIDVKAADDLDHTIRETRAFLTKYPEEGASE